MKEIKLTKGKTALVDDEDFEIMNMVCWQGRKNGNCWYAMREVKIPGQGNRKKNFQMHRLILGIEDPKICIDHKDGNGLNNQRNNLRIASKSQNAWNMKKYLKECSSKFKGVHRAKGRNRWTAGIKKDGVKFALGQFRTEHDAAMAYNKKAIELHGEFANLNLV